MTEKPPHIVVTGASGFVGTHVMRTLVEAGEYPVGLCRKPTKGLVHGFDLSDMGDLSNVLKGAKAVVHCAARVHGKEDPKTEREDHLKANRDGTAELLRQAEVAGVQHFVFLSTVAVYGLEQSDQVIALDHPTAPNTAYGQAKLEAEAILQASPMRTTILRVPMVYGPHAPGLWRKLMRLCASRYPLPFNYAGNRRSMMAVQNLADLIRHCLQSEATPELILTTDHDDLGTTRICTELRKAMGKSQRLFTVPKGLMRGAANLVRRPYLYEQLYESLQFAPTDCGWTPPLTANEALRRCVPVK
ncbi:MAG: NAD-dependent epimerase/dehydratase family protein [Cognatishimia sp.]|uniref:NAD-dependent epimerase/dehydratase family protein n=1 Tax=Cognatishimia sp. TaxID=2211648 RepID=UPI003B8CB05D